jgi:hypothetical protein
LYDWDRRERPHRAGRWGVRISLAMGSLALPAYADGVDLKVYGDVDYAVRNHSEVSNTFSAAQFEFFPTADVDRGSFLAEVVAEGDTSTNEVGVEVERLQVGYLFADWLRLKAGRMHTAFGYYNDGYHHGKFFELTTGRPYLVNFEDAGGLLVAHLVGVAVDGKASLGSAGDLHYDLEVGNGRARTIEEVAVAGARKNTKMVNLRLRLLPNFAEGLVVGANVEIDEVPPSPISTTTDVASPIPHTLREVVIGAHVVYMEHHFHLLGEFATVRHQDVVTEVTYRTYGGFAEVGYSFGDFTPYGRYELLRFDAKRDPLFEQGLLGGTDRVQDVRVGIKWNPTGNLALKLEGRTTHVDPATTSIRPSQQTGTLQCAFGF